MKLVMALFIMTFWVASFLFVKPADATNGNHLIGASPASLSMGGAGIALPQDFTAAIFSNPASIGSGGFGGYGKGYELDLGVVAAFPKTEGKISTGGVTFKGSNTGDLLTIPSVSFKLPIERSFPRWRAGVGIVGVAGIKVDYRGSSIDRPTHYLGAFPLAKGLMAELQVSRLSPTVAYYLLENLSVGLSLHLGHAGLDLGIGDSTDNAIGAQIGMLYSHNDRFSLGATYISSQDFTFKDVSDLDGDSLLDSFDLEMPREIGIGVGYVFPKEKLLFSADIKWKNWSHAKGYKELDWDDQWILALGARYDATEKLALMAGYNYGQNPVKRHNNFVGTSLVDLQGKKVPGYYYETFRILGNPAVEEHHAALGIGYEVTKWLAMHLNYTHVFSESIEESGTDILGVPVSILSKAGADAVAIGFVSRF